MQVLVVSRMYLLSSQATSIHPERRRANCSCGSCTCSPAPGRQLGGNPWIGRPAIPESFSRRLSCVKRGFAGFALAGLPLAKKETLRPKIQPRLSLIRQAALGGPPGKTILPRLARLLLALQLSLLSVFCSHSQGLRRSPEAPLKGRRHLVLAAH